ncbi:MAG: hypothetical protein ACX93P_08210 [Roseovarius sp.]
MHQVVAHKCRVERGEMLVFGQRVDFRSRERRHVLNIFQSDHFIRLPIRGSLANSGPQGLDIRQINQTPLIQPPAIRPLRDIVRSIDPVGASLSLSFKPLALFPYVVGYRQGVPNQASPKSASLSLSQEFNLTMPGGDFIFTDPMRANDIDDASAFQPIYERIHLPDMDSIGAYQATLEDVGFDTVEIEDLTHQLRNHCARVREELQSRRHALEDQISPDYAERMLNGLKHWFDGADAGQLFWGLLHLRKH